MVPQTPSGRVLVVVLMAVGIGLFGAMTANFASTLVRRRDRDTSMEDLVNEVRMLRSELTRVRADSD